jgi:hypothetical protein
METNTVCLNLYVADVYGREKSRIGAKEGEESKIRHEALTAIEYIKVVRKRGLEIFNDKYKQAETLFTMALRQEECLSMQATV